MQKILELIVAPKSSKKKEFNQSLNDLARALESSCSKMKIDGSEESSTISVLMEWETEDQMHRTFESNEFAILSGAITALCEKVQIRLNDKLVGNHISMLANIKKTKPKYQKS